MPQRFLRPGITNSDLWNAVSMECQSFYIRILTLVDDYGRHDGRPAVLAGQCFAVWNAMHPDKSINLQQVEQMLQQLAATFLIELYEVGGKKILQVTQWQERIRDGVKQKWPAKGDLQQVAASCSKLLPSSPPPSPSSTPSSPPPPAGNGGRFMPTWEDCKQWLSLAHSCGADYTQAETKAAFLALQANGWMWGKNPVADWRAALERQIGTDRDRKPKKQRATSGGAL